MITLYYIAAVIVVCGLLSDIHVLRLRIERLERKIKVMGEEP